MSTSVDTQLYDPVRRLCELGLHALAAAVRDNNECTISTAHGRFAVYKAGCCINVVQGSDGQPWIRLGDPCSSRPLLFRPNEIRASPGVSQDPYLPSLSFERLRNDG
jgi:hypothetical protein